jgi:hypothetical protein
MGRGLMAAQRSSGINRSIRHCERSEAIQWVSNRGLVWIASLSLAMTVSAILLFADGPSV